ncbi:MAG: cytochrome C biogenesis protein [Candidatus Muiribacterium halophilum]|uniref:Cytochrome C biogenesis protein n=1 Tax=Muiribacterium halophilum TaxID=2053465 RepID=A0A2N5ZMD8_MUIH1|nr:MAG: cytochrome C biogenesis protein [Candidatus Muirbacterium halophilum]
MQQIFIYFTEAINGAPALALFASFMWGVLSILLSPCHLASIPLIVGFIDEQESLSTKRAFYISSIFSFGILLTIALLGIITASMGRMAGDIGNIGNYIVSIVFFIVGLHLLEVIPLSIPGASNVKTKKKGILAAFFLGLIFGIALGPCTFAYMAPVLSLTFRIASSRMLFAIMLLLFYGIGHCSVIVFAGTFAEFVQHILDLNKKSKATIVIKKICGVLVIIGGLYNLYLAV